MQPNIADRHVSVPLTNISLAFQQDPNDYVARRVFPIIPVDKPYDQYYTYPLADLIRVQMTERAPSAESTEAKWTISRTPYSCKVFSLKRLIDDRDRATADAVFNLDEEATVFLTSQAMLKEEVDFATNYMTAGVWGTTITGVSASPGANQVLHWSDGASTPIEDIRTGKEAIKLSTGQRANVLVLTEAVWNKLQDHPDFLSRIRGGATAGAPAIVQRQLLASILELDEVLVMGGIQNLAGDGLAASNSFIGGKSALLCHRPARPGRMTPSAGYTFAWTAYLGGTTATRIKRWREESRASDVIEIESAYVQQITSSALGYFFNSIVA